jgi:uncharacterized protein (TIGR03032 family)
MISCVFKLDTEFYKLPLEIDAERLAWEVNQFPESDWRPHPQGNPGNSALLFCTVGGTQNDEVKGPMRPTSLLDRCSYIQQIFASFQAPIGRARLMRIEGQGDATEHVDTNYYWMHHIRIHIPAVTNPGVRFLCDDKSVHMAPGEVWIFDSWKRHNVLNPADYSRIHLVVDTVGSEPFWNLIERSEKPFAESPAAEGVISVPYREGVKPALEFEEENFPIVMSPFEQQVLAGRMLEGIVAGADKLPRLHTHLERLHQQWHALWTRHRDRESGREEFQSLIAAFDAKLPELTDGMMLFNKVPVIEALRQAIIRPAVSPEVAKFYSTPAPAPAKAEPAPAPQPVARRELVANLHRPVFIVAAPRSGSSLLFELLTLSPDVWTIGGESHLIIEGIDALKPANRNFNSNALTEADATPEISAQLQQSFLKELRNRHGNGLPATAGAVRMLEKTPKNALRIPFLAKAFPDARFIYLYRDPAPNISSIIDAWRSERFVTYPELPDWNGPKWSLLLIPGWRELNGKPLAEIATQQWVTANQTILDELGQIPADRWCTASYDEILANPQALAQRLCDFAHVGWDQNIKEKLPESKHTLTPPDPDKWRRNEAEMAPFLNATDAIAARVKPILPEIVPAPAAPQPTQPLSTMQNSPAPTPATPAPGEAGQQPVANFSSEHTTNFPQLLKALGITIAVSTYQAGKLIFVRAQGDVLNTHFRDFFSPMGLAYHEGQFAVGTKHEVWSLRNFQQLGDKVDPNAKHDAVFLPGSRLVTGDIRIHEIAWGRNRELWAVNTRFSCLCTFDGYHSFVPRWKPPFIDALTAEDRCHLNGLAMRDGVPAYVSCHAPTNTPEGWRGHKLDGGTILDVATGEVVLNGLCMPHSPRLHAGHLWYLESGHGRLCAYNFETRETKVVAELPGFTRGLEFHGQFAFIGLSQVRESAVFSGIPISEPGRERQCGVWVVDITTGNIVSFLRFSGTVQEIFALLPLPFANPELITDNTELIGGAFFVPPEALPETSTQAVQESVPIGSVPQPA